MDSRLFTMLAALLLVLLAGLFEGAETGIYRLSRLRLRLSVERRQWLSILLAKVMEDSSGLLLSLLVGTTLAHYIATSFVTGMFLDLVTSEQAAEVYATIVMTPLLFVFSQLIPKNAFLYGADVLTSVLSPLLYVNYQVLKWCGVVPLLRGASGLFGKLIRAPAVDQAMITSTRAREVKALVRDTQEEGLLSRVQMEMVDRIVNLPRLRLSAAMIPLDRVESVNIRHNRAALLTELSRQALTRLLVWRDSPENIVGFIDIYEALGLETPFESLEGLVRPLRTLDADTPIVDAIDMMRREERKIILVTRRRAAHEAPAGIVTMKDLVEELVGELAAW
jgi:putative hemolysin